MNYIEKETKKVLCKHCNNTFLATKENFYTKKGKLAIDICKQCKRDKVKMYKLSLPKRIQKNNSRNRKETNKKYYLKKKLEKEALKSNEI